MPSFKTSDDINLAYRDEGTGLPVIALSGLTRNADDFNFVAPHLSDIRLIRMDYRGRGRSDWAPYQTYTIPQEAQDVLALMDHLKLEQAAILGTSRGGLIAMGLAAMAKDRLMGACLNDIGPEIAPGGMEAILDYLGRPAAGKTYDEIAPKRARIMEAIGFKNVPARRWEDEVRHLYTETTTGLENRYDPRLRDAILAAREGPEVDLWPFFDALADLPLALIRGDASNILSVETTAEMRRRRPDMIFAQVPGRGHVPFLDEPEARSAIRRWIDQLR